MPMPISLESFSSTNVCEFPSFWYSLKPTLNLVLVLSIYVCMNWGATFWTPRIWSITAISHPPWSYPRDEDSLCTTAFRSSLVRLFTLLPVCFPPSSGIQIHFQHDNIRKQPHNELFWELLATTPRQLAVYLQAEVRRKTPIVYFMAECHVVALWNYLPPSPLPTPPPHPCA